MGYSFRLAARVLLYASSHRLNNTYHGLCYTSRGELAGSRNSSMGPPHEGSILQPVKKATPIVMLYGELGRMPIELTIYRRMVCYWARLISGKQSKLSALLYKIMLNHNLTNGTNYNWINTVKNTLDNLGMGDVWITQSFISVNCLSQQIKQRQHDQYLQTWKDNISQSSRGNTYRLYKEQLYFESYINKLPEKLWTKILKFRTSNHYLRVETGRWNNIRIEFVHYVMQWTLATSSIIFSFAIFFITQRVQLIHPYYYTLLSIYKFRELMENKRISTLKKLACFINIINNEFKRPWLQTPSDPPKFYKILPLYTVPYTRLTIYSFISTSIPGYVY